MIGNIHQTFNHRIQITANHSKFVTTAYINALAGVAAETGVIMLIYLKHAWQDRLDAGLNDDGSLLDAIREGAVLRVRPKAMTVAVILAGLLPLFIGGGAGSEVMQRIAAPMVGGMITAPLLSMLVIPAAYLLLRRRGLSGEDPVHEASVEGGMASTG